MRRYPERHPAPPVTVSNAFRGLVIALFWSCAFWLLFVVAPLAWHNGWRPW